MVRKDVVPFGGIHGWLADLTVPKKDRRVTTRFPRERSVIESYYVAEADKHQAMTAIRVHADVGTDALLVARRSLSRRDVDGLRLKPGQVKLA
jgi:hypothetical protein